MDVDRASDPRREHGGIEDAHEAGEHDEIGRLVGDAREEIRIEARAIGIAARIERERRDAGFFGAPERLRVCLVARDQHDLDRHAPRAFGFDQRLEIGAAARRENGDAQSHADSAGSSGAQAIATRSPRAGTTSPIATASSPSAASAAIVDALADAATISV